VIHWIDGAKRSLEINSARCHRGRPGQSRHVPDVNELIWTDFDPTLAEIA
jgi:hypothetical protein